MAARQPIPESSLLGGPLDQMRTAAVTKDGADAPFNYGFGWFIDSYHGHRFVQHSGGTPGFSSVIYRFVDDKLTIIILTNHADRIVDQLAIDLAGIGSPTLKRPAPNYDPNPTTTATLKQLVSGLLKGEYEPASFTPAMGIFLSTATGKAFWKWLRYKVSLGGEWYWFSAKMTKDGKIAQIYWW